MHVIAPVPGSSANFDWLRAVSHTSETIDRIQIIIHTSNPRGTHEKGGAGVVQRYLYCMGRYLYTMNHKLIYKRKDIYLRITS